MCDVKRPGVYGDVNARISTCTRALVVTVSFVECVRGILVARIFSALLIDFPLRNEYELCDGAERNGRSRNLSGTLDDPAYPCRSLDLN